VGVFGSTVGSAVVGSGLGGVRVTGSRVGLALGRGVSVLVTVALAIMFVIAAVGVRKTGLASNVGAGLWPRGAMNGVAVAVGAQALSNKNNTQYKIHIAY